MHAVAVGDRTIEERRLSVNEKLFRHDPQDRSKFALYGAIDDNEVTAPTDGDCSVVEDRDYGTTSPHNIFGHVRTAYRNSDTEGSRRLHLLKHEMSRSRLVIANHLQGGGHLKSAVFGGLDGIMTTFATVTSVAGSGLPHSVILIIGLAHLVADGMSMGLGDMLSSEAETDLVKHERKRETWEFENYPEGEVNEMIDLYTQKGVSEDDAQLIVGTLAKYKEAFIDVMMLEELNLVPCEDDGSSFQGGLVTFFSFMLCGVVPLLPFLLNLLPFVHMSASLVFNISSGLTLLSLFVLGAVKGNLVGQSWWRSGGTMAFNGGVAATFGWIVGYLLQCIGVENK